jgi:hypothetical protein
VQVTPYVMAEGMNPFMAAAAPAADSLAAPAEPPAAQPPATALDAAVFAAPPMDQGPTSTGSGPTIATPGNPLLLVNDKHIEGLHIDRESILQRVRTREWHGVSRM